LEQTRTSTVDEDSNTTTTSRRRMSERIATSSQPTNSRISQNTRRKSVQPKATHGADAEVVVSDELAADQGTDEATINLVSSITLDPISTLVSVTEAYIMRLAKELQRQSLIALRAEPNVLDAREALSAQGTDMLFRPSIILSLRPFYCIFHSTALTAFALLF
jgi:hypothetical protein